MTQRNNILLIVKQQPGIDYNSLLSKISSSYGSINSARAALSRAIKDLSALGMLKRQGNALFVTDKGATEINREMKNKLLIKLNQSLREKNPVGGINSIVEMLSTLIERSKQDRDLLKAARGSTEFYIRDLVELKSSLDKRIRHLNYLSEIMLHQIASLRELNFNDSVKLRFDSETKQLLSSLVNESQLNEITIESRNPAFMQSLGSELNLKPAGSVSIEKKRFPQMLSFIEKSSKGQSNPVNVYLPPLKIRMDLPYVYLIGPFKRLNSLFQKRL
jgi:hypothetical protein